MKGHGDISGMKDIFSAGGLLSKAFPGFESRPQQLEMAEAVAAAFENKRRLVAEAGTGVGKSFAYLVPAIDRAAAGEGRVVVSTFTIALQEQLINKDIPLLLRCMPRPFTAVLAKGRGNYLCKRRLEFAMRRQQGLFDELGSELALIKDWSSHSEDGSLSDIPFVPKGHVWDAVRSEHGNCRGRKCPLFGQCFYWRARRRLENAHVIVANHALLFADLALREQGAAVLPDYRSVVIDEAHNMEHVAEEQFGIDLSNHAVKFLLDGLYNPRTHKGLVVYAGAERLTDAVVRAGEEAKNFFRDVREWYNRNKNGTNGRCPRSFIDNTLAGPMNDLRTGLAKQAKEAGDEDEQFEFRRNIDRCAGVIEQLQNFLGQARADFVYWVEVSEHGRPTVALRSAAINVGPDIKRCLFDKFESVVMTSATISVNCGRGKGGFEFFAGRVGLENYDVLRVGSPFDYQRQVTMYVEKNLPEPNSEQFAEQATEAVKKYILQTQGRAFVLFTSYDMLKCFAERLAGWLGENDIELLQQGAGIDRSSLLKEFRKDHRSILFGTDSFWQGVDVPGEALSNVIIVRLPFAVPDTPLLAGRLDKIREEGGNPFLDYQLPLAIIKFKQGFGRLIRTRTDTGIVVVLDSRILGKPYGRQFLAAVPKCKMEIMTRPHRGRS